MTALLKTRRPSLDRKVRLFRFISNCSRCPASRWSKRPLAPANHRVGSRLQIEIRLRPHRLDDVDNCRETGRYRSSAAENWAISMSSGRMPSSIGFPTNSRRRPFAAARRTWIVPPSISEKQEPSRSCFRVPLMKFMGGLPRNPATNKVHGLIVKLQRGIGLLHQPVIHDDNAVPHGHGLNLVVGDVDHGGLQTLMQLGDLGSHLHPHLGVEI